MSIVVLTTDTSHHAHFVRALRDGYGSVTVFCETGASPRPPFETRHPFEDTRDAHEWDLWFSSRRTSVAALGPTHAFASINNADAVEAMRRAAPDWVIVFGTGMIKQPMLEVCGGRIFNLHGGDPESYRGLDTHMWAVWHRDFDGIGDYIAPCRHGTGYRRHRGPGSGRVAARNEAV